MDRGAWWATVCGVARVGHDLATEQQQRTYCIAQGTLLNNVQWPIWEKNLKKSGWIDMCN